MDLFTYISLIAGPFAFGGLADHLWVTYIRPKLAVRFGWHELHPSELIPPYAWIGAMLFSIIFFILLPEASLHWEKH